MENPKMSFGNNKNIISKLHFKISFAIIFLKYNFEIKHCFSNWCIDFVPYLTPYKFIMKNRSFKMLVAFLLIFVEDTKITFVYNFVAF